jgi:protein tyrosine/serine phosphatase
MITRTREHWIRAAVLLIAHVSLSTLGACAAAPSHSDRDLPNFRQVSAGLYRGAQPTAAGFQRLHDMGIRTIVNVRGGDIDRHAMGDLPFDYRQRPMSPWSPCDDDVLWFLKIATDADTPPVFLHCQHGADRSGYLVAMYRVVVEGWDRQRAIDEMTAHGMGFHDIYQGLIDYVREADVADLRRRMDRPMESQGSSVRGARNSIFGAPVISRAPR